MLNKEPMKVNELIILGIGMTYTHKKKMRYFLFKN